MDRPAFLLYVGDWLSDVKLRRCSPGARGVWMDVLCYMHDADEYGILRWPLREIVNATGAPLALLRELIDKGVMPGCDKGECEPLVFVPKSGRKKGAPVTLVAPQQGPIWYSRRMVRDEYIRQRRGEATRFGASPMHSPNPPFGERHGDENDSPKPVKSAGPSLSLSKEVIQRSATSTGVGSDQPGFARSAAGQVGEAAVAAGISRDDVHLEDPVLAELLRAGALLEQFSEAFAKAVDTGRANPWPWALARVQGRLQDAAATAQAVGKPWHETRSGIEAKGVELGIGPWDEAAAAAGTGPYWPAYQARVYRAAGHTPQEVA